MTVESANIPMCQSSCQPGHLVWKPARTKAGTAWALLTPFLFLEIYAGDPKNRTDIFSELFSSNEGGWPFHKRKYNRSDFLLTVCPESAIFCFTNTTGDSDNPCMISSILGYRQRGFKAKRRNEKWQLKQGGSSNNHWTHLYQDQ